MAPSLALALLALLVFPVLAAGDPSATPPRVETVTVSAPRLNEETLIDRKVYQVGTDLQRTFGSVGDVLGAIPSITVDADGGLALRGDANVLILVDGKPSARFADRSVAESLLSLPAQDIERIEVLTTPPPEFKADGTAGVINIVMRSKRRAGLVGQAQGGIGPQGRVASGANLSWQEGGVGISAVVGFRQEVRQRQLRSDLRTTAAPGVPSGNSTALTDETIHRSSPSVELNGEAVLDAHQSVSAALSWSRRGGLRTYSEQTAVFADGAGLTGAGPAGSGLINSGPTNPGLTSAAGRGSRGHDPESGLDARLGYAHKFDLLDGRLNLTLHRSDIHQHEHYDYADTSFLPPSATTFSNLDFLETHAITDLGADYVASLGEGQTLKLGYAFQLDNYDFGNAAATLDPVTGAANPNLNLTNDFQYRQRLHAVYGSYQATMGAWTWLAGLRAEQALTETTQITNQTYQGNQYFKAYPSLHVDRAVSDNDAVFLGASERITRPEPSLLNPFVDHEYTPNLQAGNPGLRPQTTWSFELGLDHEADGQHYGVTGYLRRNRDSVTDVTQALGNGLSLTTKANLPRSDAAGAEFTISGKWTPRLAYSVSANAFYSQIDASGLGQSGLQSTTGLNAKLKLNYHAAAGDAAQMTFSRTDRRLTPQGLVSAVNLVNLGYRHPLDADLTAVATVTDAFHGQRVERIVTTPAFTADYVRAVQGRVLYVGLVYRFGATRKQAEPVGFEYQE